MENAYIRYYQRQTGGGFEEEFGTLLRLPRIYQRGKGVGGIFGPLWKFLQPLLLPAANFLKNELFETGGDLIKNMAGEQKPIKEVLANRSVQIVDKLRDSAVDKIKHVLSGSGMRGSRKRTKKPINMKNKRRRVHSNIHAVRIKKSKSPRILDIFT